MTMNYVFSLKISKSNKSAAYNKGVQAGKFLKSNQVCCTIIWETKVFTLASLIVVQDILIFSDIFHPQVTQK